MGKLTVKGIAALTQPGRYSDDDGSGFHVRVDAEGRKYYVLRAHVNGKRKDIAIGSVRRMTLSAAREKARRHRDAIDSFDRTAVTVPTFAEATKLAHEARTAGFRNAKHIAQWLSTVETYAVPLIGDIAVDRIARGDVVKVLRPIWLEKKETAQRLLQRIDRIMRWAVGHGYRDDIIDMSLIRDALPPQQRRRSDVRRMPSIPWEAAPAFWKAVPMSRSVPEVRLGLSLLVLTAVRPGNISSAKREQFDLEAAVWTIPGDEMKGGVVHRVPLSAAAIDIARQAIAEGERDLIFAVRDAPLSPDTLRMAMRRMGYTETPHGFRSTFKEWARAKGWDDHLSELALAHADTNRVRAAYARSDSLEERRPMMSDWAAYLGGSPPTGE